MFGAPSILAYSDTGMYYSGAWAVAGDASKFSPQMLITLQEYQKVRERYTTFYMTLAGMFCKG